MLPLGTCSIAHMVNPPKTLYGYMLRNTFIQQGCIKVIKNNSKDIKACDKTFMLQIYVY